MSLIDRLVGSEDPGISSHMFFGALALFADGELTRSEVEAAFSIATTGTDKTELDFLVNTYTGITGTAVEVALKQRKFLDTLHAIFLLTEHDSFTSKWTKAQLQTILTNAAA